MGLCRAAADNCAQFVGWKYYVLAPSSLCAEHDIVPVEPRSPSWLLLVGGRMCLLPGPCILLKVRATREDNRLPGGFVVCGMCCLYMIVQEHPSCCRAWAAASSASMASEPFTRALSSSPPTTTVALTTVSWNSSSCADNSMPSTFAAAE